MKNGKVCFGVIIGTRAYFNSELARDVKKQLLKTLDEKGYEYVILPPSRHSKTVSRMLNSSAHTATR